MTLQIIQLLFKIKNLKIKKKIYMGPDPLYQKNSGPMGLGLGLGTEHNILGPMGLGLGPRPNILGPMGLGLGLGTKHNILGPMGLGLGPRPNILGPMGQGPGPWAQTRTKNPLI